VWTPTPVVLPADEAPHPQSSMEWWYFTGHLSGRDWLGTTHKYGYEVTFIRMDGLAAEPALGAWNAHFAITDLTRGTFTQTMTNFTFQPSLVPWGGGFDNWVNGWHMTGKNGNNTVSAAFTDLSYSLFLNLKQTKPAAKHGGADGIIPYGPFGTSAYYSQTDLKASGTIFDHGMPITVTGTGWLDHQWGDFNAGPGGWEWFAVQLDNGTQYMLYFVQDPTGVVETIGTKINPDGSTVDLDPSQVTMTELGTWTSPKTGKVWPQNWRVTVPGGSMNVTVKLPDQELTRPFMPTKPAYWEGATWVNGTINGATVKGQGYTEVTPVSNFPTRGNFGDFTSG